jgi:hypothetical protein
MRSRGVSGLADSWLKGKSETAYAMRHTGHRHDNMDVLTMAHFCEPPELEIGAVTEPAPLTRPSDELDDVADAWL